MAKPKLADVARVAGVSPTTVSRVLNSRGYLSQETREKVYEAMREINYRPNAIARSLQEQKTHLIGLVFPTVSNPFYGELAYRIESKLADAGYKVILCNSEDHPELEARYLDMLMGNQVDGLVTGAHSDVLALAPHLEAPLVTIDRITGGRYPNIRCDNFAGAFQATESLIATGARRIVHFTSTVSEQNLRQQGYSKAMSAAGLEPEIVELGFRSSDGEHRQTINNFLDSEPTVEAVFASNDGYAAMALQWAYVRSKKVPEDFSVIGFDGTPAVRSLLPQLATVVQPFELMAERTVQLLLAAIDGAGSKGTESDPSDDSPADHNLPVELYLGQTVKAQSNAE